MRAPLKLTAILLAAGLATTAIPVARAADPAAAAPASQPAAPDLDGRLAAIDSLRDALRRDAAAAGTNADEVLTRVQENTDEARALAAAGETDVARGLLDDAYKLLARTIAQTKRGVVPVHEPGSADPQAAQVKARQDFTRELNASRTLLDAYRRLDADRSDAAEIARLAKELDGAEQTAKGTGNAGANGANLAAATARLHETYAQIKGGITRLGHLESAAPGSMTNGKPTTAELQLRGERKIQETRALLDALKRLGKAPATQKLAADIDAQLTAADQRRATDPQAALDQAEDAYSRVKIGLQSLQQPAAKPAKTARPAAPTKGTAQTSAETARSTEFINRLESVRLLRGTLVRLSRDRKVDNGPALAKADRLTGEAKRLSRDSLPLALATIDEAYAVVKQAVIATQSR